MRVVCISANWGYVCYGNQPKKDEVVTVLRQCSMYPENWDIEGYLTDYDGRLQSFGKRHFVPLDEYLDGISIEAEIAECLTIKEFELV